MTRNTELEKEILKAIKWQPSLEQEIIAVSAVDGIVTLTGVVDSYVKKKDVENTVSKVLGVKGLVENIEVDFPDLLLRNSDEIAREAVRFLESNESVAHDKIVVKVENGWVTLEGEVLDNRDKVAAHEAIHYITGIKGITNNIKTMNSLISSNKQITN